MPPLVTFSEFCVFSRLWLTYYRHLVFLMLLRETPMALQTCKKTKWLWMAASAWFAALALAFGIIAMEDGRAGAQGTAPQAWPVDSKIAVQPGKPTLVMFMHPRCPCSSASLAEFERMIPQLSEPTMLVVMFVKPASAPEGWENTGLCQRARELPGVTVMIDEGGREAKRFGARTSGQVVVYSATGELTFQGGITAGRGHEGANAGQQGALESARGGQSCCSKSEVYGCQLDDEECNDR
jgi:hypothetical protein